MAAPSTAISRLDYSLGIQEFHNRLNRMKFIGHRVFPAMYVTYQTAKFRKLRATDLIRPIEDTRRNADGSYKRDDFAWDWDSYATDEHGKEKPLDDRQVKQYQDVIDQYRIKVDAVINDIADAYEAEAAAAAFNETTFATGLVQLGTTSGYSVPWDRMSGSTALGKTTADPIRDLDKLRQAFISQCGVTPNALVMEMQAALAMVRTDRVESIVKFTGGASGDADAFVVRKVIPMLEEALMIDNIIIADSPVKNVAGRGQTTPTFRRLWDPSYVLMTRIYDGPDVEYPYPHIGRTMMWSEESGPLPGQGPEENGVGCLIEEYREEPRRGAVIRGRTDYQIKIMQSAAGILMKTVTENASA